MTTPNFQGISARILGTRWRVVADEHLTYFDTTSLVRFLARNGFERIRITSTGLDIVPLVGWLRGLGGARVPSAHTDRPPTEAAPDGAKATSAVADKAITAVNLVLGSLGLGDSLKAWAERP